MDIKIISEKETVDKIYNEKCSICRFGDGEIYHLYHNNSKYGSGGQICKPYIQQKLVNILNNIDNNKKILIGFSGYFNDEETIKNRYVKRHISKNFLRFRNRYKKNLYNTFPHLFNNSELLYSAEITRLHQIKERKYICNIFNKIFCENKCIFVGNNKVIQLVKNILLDKFKSIEFIEAPSSNAYFVYEKIMQQINNINPDKNKVILSSLGITSTIMSYELAEKGFWAIDIGHYFELYK